VPHPGSGPDAGVHAVSPPTARSGS
jgi:hypothetical protein